MYLCMYVCIYTCVYMCVFVCVYQYIHVYIFFFQLSVLCCNIMYCYVACHFMHIFPRKNSYSITAANEDPKLIKFN